MSFGTRLSAKAIARSRKIVRGLKQGLTEEERYAVSITRSRS
jgi:hypothetical protein